MAEKTQQLHGKLEKQGLTDLIKRGKNGSFIYPVIWLVIAVTNGLYNTHLNLLLSNTAILLLLATTRTSLGFLSAGFVDKHHKIVTKVYEITVIAQGFHFGLLSTYVYSNEELQALVFPMILSASGIVSAGTATLAINKLIRIFFPAFIIAPFFLFLIFHPSTENYLLAAVALIFIFYIIAATKNMYNDYWSAITNSALLTERAVGLKQLSITDPLTKTYNRSFLNNHIDKEWKRSYRNKQAVTAMFVDLDYFKQINDEFGHAAGDLCIKEAAELLKKHTLRSGDIVARYGGDEFVTFLADTEASNAAIVAKNIIDDFRTLKIKWHGNFITLRCSIGICSYIPDKSNKQSDLLINADTALYKAKEDGRDRYTIYNR